MVWQYLAGGGALERRKRRRRKRKFGLTIPQWLRRSGGPTMFWASRSTSYGSSAFAFRHHLPARFYSAPSSTAGSGSYAQSCPIEIALQTTLRSSAANPPAERTIVAALIRTLSKKEKESYADGSLHQQADAFLRVTRSPCAEQSTPSETGCEGVGNNATVARQGRARKSKKWPEV